jgi:hypothetical protein
MFFVTLFISLIIDSNIKIEFPLIQLICNVFLTGISLLTIVIFYPKIIGIKNIMLIESVLMKIQDSRYKSLLVIIRKIINNISK